MTESKFGKPADLLRRPQPAKGPGVPGGKGLLPAKGSDGRVSFAPGDSLFHQGDPGGDLFFIESGVVEIYTTKEQEVVILSEMTQGEIIGVMTCLTSEARMASARAKTAVVCKKVPHSSITKVLQALPNWMKIVLKEFTIRLQQMNKVYSESVMRIKKLEATQISNVYTGAQLASAFGSVAEYLAIKQEDSKIVVVDDLLAKLEFVLNIKKEEIDRVFAVLLEAGLVKLEIEMERKRTIVRLENAQKLSYFAQFVRESRHGATKKLVRARFTHKETRVMSAIVKFAQRLEMDMDKTGKLAVADLEKSLEKATGVKFERDALEKGIKLKLLTVEGEGEGSGGQVVMKPSHLGRTVACVEAVRKLAALDSQSFGEAGRSGKDEAA